MDVAPLRYEIVRTRNLSFEVATAGRGERLALLLHGFPECAHSFRHQIPLLERLGYRVWAPNLRGYGKSDRPEGRKAYTMDKLEQDVTDLIDESGAKSVLLVGHDWGGNIAWSYAAHGQRPIDKLVVLNCAHPVLFRRGMATAAQLKRSWYVFFFQLPWLPERLLAASDYRLIDRMVRGTAVHKELFTDADIALFRANAAQPGAMTAMLNYFRGIPPSLPMVKRRGNKKVQAPTLLIWGERDVALGKELVQGTERLVSDLTVRYIPDASHWVQQDAPETVNALLEEWLTRSSAQTEKSAASAV